jgi:hypothetical protein
MWLAPGRGRKEAHMMRWALLLAALVLAARFGSADDKARSRDGSSSSGGSSDAGARHHSSSSSSSSSSENHGSSSSSSSSSSASSDASDPTPAQRRHPRAGTGTGYTYGNGYYDNGYGYPYYGSFYFGYPAYYYGYAGYPAYYGQPYYAAAYGSGYPNVGSLRLIVEPEKTKVYVDGYYAGVADDFDGIFQRLHLSTGPPRNHAEARRLSQSALPRLRPRGPHHQAALRHGPRPRRAARRGRR